MAWTRRGRRGGAAAAAVSIAVLGGCSGGDPVSAPPVALAHPTRSGPAVATPTSAARTASRPAGEPVRVVVTGADGRRLVDAPVRPQGLDAEGVLAPPPGVVGWYDEPGWPKPGFPGASILAGHINTAENGGDTFARLPEATAGATVSVSYDSGDTVTFEVIRSEAVPKTRTPADDTIWDASNPRPLIRLITCDPSTPVVAGHHVGNWVLWGRASA